MIMLTQNEAKQAFELIWHESNSLHELNAYQWGLILKLARESNQPASRLILIKQETKKAIDAELNEIL